MSNKYSKFFPNHDEFNLDNFPYYWITQVYGLYVAKMDNSLKKYGLDNSRRRILLTAYLYPNASVSDLSEMTLIKISTTTKILIRLREENLIETMLCPDDNRVTRVKLTQQGEEMVKKINEMTVVLFEDSFKGLKPSDIDRLNDSLKIIKQNLE
ncbi:MarR family transcriptional regulator [Acinetobacter ursingii]|mgnify:FL=1|nr:MULTISPECIES: MarR family transcriptional regulator [Acinetobacter]MDG9950471.1 MarR family transcriptional regulator [Acinetobacter ursingii]MEC6126249.1 MarR family transcriptional regulator [Acinetobacter ursingii]PZT86350.1 MAG: MarR family transcriptional regulator [Acinetobacter sp.]QXZ23751.1 MarR family transcriptional regulator [Acinetobacter septicus]RSC24016.1 MarR family transcriptional regulator [Acinetobacter sp. FDAARGOS_515]